MTISAKKQHKKAIYTNTKLIIKTLQTPPSKTNFLPLHSIKNDFHHLIKI